MQNCQSTYQNAQFNSLNDSQGTQKISERLQHYRYQQNEKARTTEPSNLPISVTLKRALPAVLLLMMTKEEFIKRLPNNELFQALLEKSNNDTDKAYKLYQQRFQRWQPIASIKKLEEEE